MKNRTLWLLAAVFLLTSLSALAQDAAKADKMLGPSVGLRLCARQVRAVYALLRGCQLTGPRAE